MKKIIITLFSIFLFVVSGCEKFLDEDLRGKVMGNTVVDNQTGLESVLAGAYKGLGSTWSMGFLHGPQAHATMGGDDRTSPASIDAGREFDTFTVTAGNSISLEIYKGCYKAIQGANNVLAHYSTAQGNPDQLNIIAGEAYFLRAFGYFWLVRLFGDIPLLTSSDFSLDLLNIEKTNVNDVYALITEDLSQAEVLLPNSKRDIGRPNKGTAKAFLADVYLTMGGWPVKDPSKYALAAEKAKEVIDNHTTYGFQLLASFTDVFENDPTKNGTAEDVFDITANKQGTGTYNSMYGWREMPSEMGGWDCCYTEINFFNNFPEGIRKDVTFATSYTKSDGTVLTYQQLITKHPFFKKFWINHGLPGYAGERSSLPVVMMRYAHVLTIYAEAMARSAGPDALAYTCLNDIRKRAGLNELNGLTAEDFASAVVQERAWEFAGEFTRWFDLVRLEKVEEANSNRDPLEPQITQPMDESVYTIPIPLYDALINPNL
jgi:hypothetical protein